MPTALCKKCHKVIMAGKRCMWCGTHSTSRGARMAAWWRHNKDAVLVGIGGLVAMYVLTLSACGREFLVNHRW